MHISYVLFSLCSQLYWLYHTSILNDLKSLYKKAHKNVSKFIEFFLFINLSKFTLVGKTASFQKCWMWSEQTGPFQGRFFADKTYTHFD
ncbi:hypothetical protein BpHYR1_054008 [Brachionus plicatilis]|uniref:Uncharacterized protein n=1 Tax=Brachionus plicatilis TaxID=10195 RepID=A0A3M7PUP3_BRAPC|nr:hypothetical protein BpHYR1_054008 [Brachionus plicatilis]